MWPTEDTPETSAENLRWRIPCANEAGADRAVSVLVLGDRVVLVLPPDQALVFDPNEALDFADLLDAAAGTASP